MTTDIVEELREWKRIADDKYPGAKPHIEVVFDRAIHDVEAVAKMRAILNDPKLSLVATTARIAEILRS